MLFSALWAYRTLVNTTTSFTPFQLVHGVEVVLLIECEIPSLNLAVELLPNTYVEEEHLIYLAHLDEHRRDDTLANETHKKHIKSQYDKSVHPHIFAKGDLVLVYDQDHEKLGARKFEPLWHGPYIVIHVLQKGAYELVDYEGNILSSLAMGSTLRSTMCKQQCCVCSLYHVVFLKFFTLEPFHFLPLVGSIHMLIMLGA
jgi:hypothetical protein